MKKNEIRKVIENGESRDTANRDLNKLIQLRIIKRQGIGKATKYSLR
jgi:hypothetical protein